MPSGLVKVRSEIVPLATEMVTGSVGLMSSESNAGEAVTWATGFGTTVVVGAVAASLPSPLSAELEPPSPVAAAWLIDPVELRATPVEEPEQAAVMARTPTASRASAAL